MSQLDILAYSPNIEVVVGMSRDGEMSYIDLSDDVVSANVGRVENGASTCDVVLNNDRGKYNGVFACFDLIAIYATKTNRHKLFTGYITKFDAFKLYGGDFRISGKCPIYTLQKLYWDKGLKESMQILRMNPYGNGDFDAGYSSLAVRLLVNVAGWNVGSIAIQEEIPQEVFDWARSLYEVKRDDITQFRSLINDFFEVLRLHGPALATGTSTSSASSAASSSGVNLSNVDVKNIDDLGADVAAQIKKLSKTRQVIVSTAIAQLGKPYVWGATGPDSFDCSGLTSYCYTAAGVSIPRVSGDQGACAPSVAVSDALPGDILWMSGHVGLYVGGGNFIHAPQPGDVVKIVSLSSWNPWVHAVRVVD